MPKSSSAVSKMPAPPMKKERAPRSRARRTTTAAMPQVAPVPMPTATPAEIALRAFQIFEARGTMPGDALADWLMAESELCAPAMR